MDDPVNDAIEATLEELRHHLGQLGRDAKREVYEELIKELDSRLKAL